MLLALLLVAGYYYNKEIMVKIMFLLTCIVSVATQIAIIIQLIESISLHHFIYLFHDKEGQFHCHKKPPVYLPQSNKYSWITSKVDKDFVSGCEPAFFDIDGPIIHVHGNGSTEGNTITNTIYNRWKVKLEGRSIRIYKNENIDEMEEGMSINGQPKTILTIIKEISCSYDACRALEKINDAKEMAKELCSVIGERDFLGVGIVLTCERILETQKDQKSRVGQEARETLEALLEKLPAASELWKRHEITDVGQERFRELMPRPFPGLSG